MKMDPFNLDEMTALNCAEPVQFVAVVLMHVIGHGYVCRATERGRWGERDILSPGERFLVRGLDLGEYIGLQIRVCVKPSVDISVR